MGGVSSANGRAKGAVHQLDVIVGEQRAGRKLTKIEERQTILNASGEPIGDRVYDAVSESPTRYIEAKAWSRETFKTRLRQSMEGRETRGNGPGDSGEHGL